MLNTKLRHLCILILLFLAAPLNAVASCGERPVVEGRFDTGCVVAMDAVALAGDWHFEYRSSDSTINYSGLATVPSSWLQLATDPPLSEKGHGVYSLIFDGDYTLKRMALDLPRMWSAREVSLLSAEGERRLVFLAGNLSEPAQVSFSPVADTIITLPDITPGTRLEIRVHNWDTRSGGLWEAPVIGYSDHLSLLESQSQLLAMAAVAVLYIFALINLSMWITRERDFSVLLLAIGAFAVATRQLSTSGVLYHLLPGLTVWFDWTSTWLCYFLGSAAGFAFIYSRFAGLLQFWLAAAIVSMSLAGLLVMSSGSLIAVQQFGDFQRPVFFLSALLVVVLILRKIDWSDFNSIFTLAGVSLLVVGVCIDIIYFELFFYRFTDSSYIDSVYCLRGVRNHLASVPIL